MTKLKSCGFLIYKEESSNGDLGAHQHDGSKQILLMRHPKRWDLPKGHVDPGETNRECALRELFEETGITENDIEIDPDFKFKQKYFVKYKRTGYQPQKKKLIIYLAKLIADVEIQLTEHDGFEWRDWNPPHEIQEKTIDPLLAEVAQYWQNCIADS